MTFLSHARRPARVVVTLGAVASLGLVSCSATEPGPTAAGGTSAAGGSSAGPSANGAGTTVTSAIAPGEPSAKQAREIGATVIDVRTPEEHAEGHVEGDRLIPLASAGFGDEIAKLDRATTYVVYCRSGNRSAQAAAQMRAIGLNVLDGGAMDDMIAAGYARAS